MRASARMRIVGACSIFINARYQHLSYARWHAWALLDVDPVGRGLKDLLKATLGL